MADASYWTYLIHVPFVVLDVSRSMLFRGCFLAAKKVTLALNALIRGQFPRDQLHIVGFSLYAREFRAEQLPGMCRVLDVPQHRPLGRGMEETAQSAADARCHLAQYRDNTRQQA